MKKFSVFILFIYCCYFCNLVNNVNINAYSEIDEYNNSVCLYESSIDNEIAVIEKDHYLLNEEIIINISYNILKVEPTINYDGFGFNIVFENIDVNGMTLKLIYNHLSLTPNLILNINDKNINIYGYVDNSYGIFISKHSEDDAAFRYFKHLYESELITLQEFEDFVTKQNSKCARFKYEENIQNTYINNSDVQLLSMDDNIVLYGWIEWVDERDINHPCQFTRIDIMDDDVVTNDVICTVYTDETGHFSAMFPNTTNETENGGYDIFLNIYAESENGKVHVRPDTLSFTYKISTKDMEDPVIYNDYIPNGTGLYFGTIVIKMDNDAGQAMQIAQTATISYKYVEELALIDIAPVGIVYPSMDDNCFYNDVLKTIYIRDKIHTYNIGGSIYKSYEMWDVIMHEYGHHIASELDLDDSYGGHHTADNNISDHYFKYFESIEPCGYCDEEISILDLEILQTSANYYYYGSRLAWGEGIANYFSLAAQDFYINRLKNISTVGDGQYKNYDYSTKDYESDSCENVITSLLYNMLDEIPENSVDETKTEEQMRAEENVIGADNFDKLSIGHDLIFSFLINSDADTLFEFVDYLLTNNLVDKGLLGRMLEFHSVSATNLDVSNETLGMYPTFEFKAGGSTYYYNTDHRIKVYDEDDNLILTINISDETSSNIDEVFYTLTEEEWNAIISATEGGIFKWQVESRHDYLDEDIYYVSSFNEVDINENENVKDLLDGTEERTFEYDSSTHWYKIQPNTMGTYTFYTSGSLDTYIEVFSNMVCDNSIIGRIAYDDDSQDGLNAKVTINLTSTETKYIRVTEEEGNHGDYTLYLNSPHNHDYIYLLNRKDINTHIEKCSLCDHTEIEIHVMDPSTKKCIYCNALVSDGIIVIGTNMCDEIIYYKEEEKYNETI